MTRHEKIEIASAIAGLATSGFTSWYLGKLLATIMKPTTLPVKIGAVIFGTVLSSWISKTVEKDVRELCNQFCEAKDNLSEIRIETENEITATVTE